MMKQNSFIGILTEIVPLPDMPESLPEYMRKPGHSDYVRKSPCADGFDYREWKKVIPDADHYRHDIEIQGWACWMAIQCRRAAEYLKTHGHLLNFCPTKPIVPMPFRVYEIAFPNEENHIGQTERTLHERGRHLKKSTKLDMLIKKYPETKATLMVEANCFRKQAVWLEKIIHNVFEPSLNEYAPFQNFVEEVEKLMRWNEETKSRVKITKWGDGIYEDIVRTYWNIVRTSETAITDLVDDDAWMEGTLFG